VKKRMCECACCEKARAVGAKYRSTEKYRQTQFRNRKRRAELYRQKQAALGRVLRGDRPPQPLHEILTIDDVVAVEEITRFSRKALSRL